MMFDERKTTTTLRVEKRRCIIFAVPQHLLFVNPSHVSEMYKRKEEKNELDNDENVEDML